MEQISQKQEKIFNQQNVFEELVTLLNKYDKQLNNLYDKLKQEKIHNESLQNELNLIKQYAIDVNTEIKNKIKYNILY